MMRSRLSRSSLLALSLALIPAACTPAQVSPEPDADVDVGSPGDAGDEGEDPGDESGGDAGNDGDAYDAGDLDGELDDGGGDWDAGPLPPDELYDAGHDDDDDEWLEDDAGASADAGTSEGEPSDAGPAAADAGGEPVEPDPEDPPPDDEGGPVACTGENANPPVPSPLPNVNTHSAFLHVYTNNVENLKTPNEQCKGDWTDLIHYMKTVKPSPDVFLVQQISNQAQLNTLVNRMSNALPGVYAGIIADANPWPQGSPCGAEKRYQTKAIIYRVGRLEPIGDKHVWQAWAFRNGECRRNTQARTRNVMQKFRDKVNEKTVTIASIHWSTFQGTGPDPACAEKNIRETHRKLRRADYRGDLLIFGGDMNEPDRFSSGAFRPWHRVANGDRNGELRWRDPVFRMCQQSNQATQACLNDNWTIGNGRRIDFLFAQDGDGCMPPTKRTHTITFNEADAASAHIVGSDNPLNYSDHRAIRSFIYY